MSKVKVSKGIAEGIKHARICFIDNAEVLQHHIRSVWSNPKCICLNKLSTYQLAEILIKDYEVELTKEEQVLVKFNVHIREFGYDLGYRKAIKDFAEIYDIKIKGINA
jgi:hypothetical protein